MDNYPLVSLIAVNFNTTSDTVEFLLSTRKLTYPNIQIIVVDNASKENPESELTALFPEVTFIRSEKNLGFAGGNNLGITIARGKYLFFLNNDTILFEDFLEPIIRFMESHPMVGMATPKIIFPDGKLQYVGSRGISPFTGKGTRLSYGEPDEGQYDMCCPTDLCHGAALIVPEHVISKVGPMPEEYFLYYEEHDWCEQVKRAGYQTYYLGCSKIIHKQSVSTGKGSPLKTYYITRNRLLFMRRNFSGFALAIGMLYFTLISLPKNLMTFLLKGEIKSLKAYCNGVLWNLRTTV